MPRSETETIDSYSEMFLVLFYFYRFSFFELVHSRRLSGFYFIYLFIYFLNKMSEDHEYMGQ